jgi:hypothetical protein
VGHNFRHSFNTVVDQLQSLSTGKYVFRTQLCRIRNVPVYQNITEKLSVSNDADVHFLFTVYKKVDDRWLRVMIFVLRCKETLAGEE